ncbi:MAG: DUF928 domain-containing protein [Cyanobacteria bacterium J06626_18]
MTWKQIGLSTYIASGLGLTGLVGTLLTMSAPGTAGYDPAPDARPPVISTDSTGGRAYEPPADSRAPTGPTDTSGGRTCGVSQNGLQMTPLAPQQHVGQTLSAHPTFTWFVPVSSALEGEFQIYELTETGPRRVFDTPYQFTSSQGFMTLTLPSEGGGLKADTDYVWQVLLRCSSRPGDIYKVRAQMAVVEAAERSPADLADLPLEQAAQLGQAGLWYDTLAAVSATPISPEAIAFRRTLLTELADLEADAEASPDPESGVVPHSEALRQIAATDSSTANLQPEQMLPNTPDGSDTEDP